MFVTDRHDMTLAVKVALNPNTTNQPITIAPVDHLLNAIQKLGLVCERLKNIKGKAEITAS